MLFTIFSQRGASHAVGSARSDLDSRGSIGKWIIHSAQGEGEWNQTKWCPKKALPITDTAYLWDVYDREQKKTQYRFPLSRNLTQWSVFFYLTEKFLFKINKNETNYKH